MVDETKGKEVADNIAEMLKAGKDEADIKAALGVTCSQIQGVKALYGFSGRRVAFLEGELKAVSKEGVLQLSVKGLENHMGHIGYAKLVGVDKAKKQIIVEFSG